MEVSVFCAEAGEDGLTALADFLSNSQALPAEARDARLKLQLIAEELFTNSMRHGGGGPVRLELQGSGDGRLELRYQDSGPPYQPFARFDPESLKAPVEQRPVGGLGLLLIESLCESVEHEALPQGNCIRLSLRYC